MAVDVWKSGVLLLLMFTLIYADLPDIGDVTRGDTAAEQAASVDQRQNNVNQQQDGAAPQVKSSADEDTENSGIEGHTHVSLSKDSTTSGHSNVDTKVESMTEDEPHEQTSTGESDQTDLAREQLKEDNGNGEITNQSYLSFGNILKSLVDPVLDSSVEVVDTTSSGINDSSLTLTNVTDGAQHDKASEEEEEFKNKTDKKVRFQCNGKNFTDPNVTVDSVKIVNNTGLLNVLNFDKNDSSCDCVLVLFFAPWCPFCANMAPNYNALARAFPQLEVLAVDAAQFSNLNARFGTVLVPNILLFHQSRAVVRFNQTDKSFDKLVSFVRNITGLEPNITVNVTLDDYDGPLSSIATEESDYLLWVAWLFVLVFTSIVFVQSTYGQQWITKVRILWQEHQHIE